VNGAKATSLLALDEAHFAEQLAHAAPALAVVAYGTNEAGDAQLRAEDHTAAVRDLVLRIQRGAPAAACLVLGPPDRGFRTLPKLVELVDAQRRAADEAGCAFYDQFAEMGGAGSMGRWAYEPVPRAQKDFVHLTRSGYATLGDALARDLVLAYDGAASSVALRGQP
jgi:lysophospholipase L1-like esterase